MPTPFTPACDGHPLAPVAGLIRVHGAEPSDAVVVELLDIAPSGEGITAVLRQFGVLHEELAEPYAAISDGIICGTGVLVRLPSRPCNAQAIARPRESVEEQQVGEARQGRKTTATTLNPICRAPRVFTSAAGPRARLP